MVPLTFYGTGIVWSPTCEMSSCLIGTYGPIPYMEKVLYGPPMCILCNMMSMIYGPPYLILNKYLMVPPYLIGYRYHMDPPHVQYGFFQHSFERGPLHVPVTLMVPPYLIWNRYHMVPPTCMYGPPHMYYMTLMVPHTLYEMQEPCNCQWLMVPHSLYGMREPCNWVPPNMYDMIFSGGLRKRSTACPNNLLLTVRGHVISFDELICEQFY